MSVRTATQSSLVLIVSHRSEMASVMEEKISQVSAVSGLEPDGRAKGARLSSGPVGQNETHPAHKAVKPICLVSVSMREYRHFRLA